MNFKKIRDYVTLQPDAEWYMVLEVTTIDVKEKPINREVQILEALHKLIGKIDDLNVNVEKLPDKEDIDKMEIEKREKISTLLPSFSNSIIWKRILSIKT